MTGLVVLGTGGHARSCLDVLIASGAEVAGCVGGPPNGPLQVERLGDDDVLPGLFASGLREVFVAIGANRVRQQITERLIADGWRPVTVISPTAYVAPTTLVGAGSILMHGAIVGPYSTVGAGVIVNTAASVDHDCVLEDFAHLAPGGHLAGTVTLRPGAFLGVGVSVVPGKTIGSWSTVGAGATVAKDIADGITAVGVPAREVGAHR